MKAEDSKLLRFIQDGPSGLDHFLSHKRLAEVIAKALRDNPTLRTVGLLGPWGSGKSTVVHQLENLVKSPGFLEVAPNGYEKIPSFQAHVYVFDAWLHQGAPVRRAFLEGLVRFAIHRKLLAPADWQEALDRVNGRVSVIETTDTPKMSWGGRFIVGAIAVWALWEKEGAHLLAIPWVGALGAKVTTSLPAWTTALIPMTLPFLAIATVAIARLTRRVVQRVASNTRTTRVRYEDDVPPVPPEPIFSLLLNRQSQTKRSRTTGAATPATIEFQKLYRSILGGMNQATGRIIVVIDNLDRLPDGEAREAWAALRTFAVPPEPDTDELAIATPVLLVPVADDAVAALYEGETATGSRAEGFMHKTFDVTFHVPRPILGQWDAYLEAKLREVFGSELVDTAGPLIKRLVEDRFGDAASVITPRRINAFVNLLLVYWLQNQEREQIDLSIVAYYCLHKAAIDKNVVGALAVDVPLLAQKGNVWRSGVAALHYGVPISVGNTVLRNESLEQLLNEGNLSLFDSLMRQPDAPVYFLGRLRKLWESETLCPPHAFFNVLKLVTSSQNLTANDRDEALSRSWRLLDKSDVWTDLKNDHIELLIRLAGEVTPEERSAALGAINRAFFRCGDNSEKMAAYAVRFWSTIKPDAGLEVSSVSPLYIPGTAPSFIKAIGPHFQEREFLKMLAPLSAPQLEQALIADIQPAPDKIHLLKVKEVCHRLLATWWTGKVVNWSQCLAACRTNVERAALTDPLTPVQMDWLRPSLLAMSLLRTANDDVKFSLDQMDLDDRLSKLATQLMQATQFEPFAQLVGLALAVGIWPKSNTIFTFNNTSDNDRRLIVEVLDTTLEFALDDVQKTKSLQSLAKQPGRADSLSIRNMLNAVEAYRLDLHQGT